MEILEKLKKSKFRSKFKLKAKDIEYIKEKGLEKIHSHAVDFIRERISPCYIPNDGKQTPMRGHPVFIAQHATATHKFPKNIQLNTTQQEYLVSIIMEWIKNQII